MVGAMKRGILVGILITAACGGGGNKVVTIVPEDTVTGPAEDPPVPGGEAVTFAGDGVTISATYWPPAAAGTQACAVFVHQLSSTRAEYRPVIERLAGQGHLLALDMRGHGASTTGDGGAKLDWEQFETADWERVAGDVGAAAELLAQKGATGPCVFIGSSIGSSAVLRHAGAHPDRVRALVLLSPGLAYRGVKTPDAARANRAPVLIVHSQEGGAADAAGALAGIWGETTPPVPVEVIADPGEAHGMKIVAGDPAILERVVGFISGELAK
jgi:pimeloyl-ACP methyl ester carboxylesterase